MKLNYFGQFDNEVVLGLINQYQWYHYYLPNLHRMKLILISNYSLCILQDYVPTRQDILHSRKATKGILEHSIDIKNVPFRFVDVGGQRSQRQKWFQCFEGVTSILFLVSSSEFDQVLMEDRQTNRLIESCNIFDTIVNHKYFANVSIILFLNKTDLLEKKIKHVSIKKWFPNFSGESTDLNTVQAFILNMFDMRRRERSKALFHHFTTAVDTQNIKYVFNAVRDTILEENLKRLMLQWCKSVGFLTSMLHFSPSCISYIYFHFEL